MRPKKEDPGFVELPKDLGVLQNAVKNEFNVTTKQICRALQCSRSFVSDHCRDIRHIHVSRRWGEAVDHPQGGTLWSLPELDSMVAASTIERRTRVISFCDFTDEPDELAWYERASERNRKLINAPVEDWKRHWDSCWSHYMSFVPLEWSAAFEDDRGRRDTPWVDLGESAGGFQGLAGWKTTFDRRDYGDSDEEWHRAYWDHGARRLTLRLPDGATRVFYAADPNPTSRRVWFMAKPLAVDLIPAGYIKDQIIDGKGTLGPELHIGWNARPDSFSC